jgi:hypothetical protein
MFIASLLLADVLSHHGDDWQDHFSISVAQIECSIDDDDYPMNRGPRIRTPEEIVLVEERRITVERSDRVRENERRKAKRQSKA